MPDVAYHTFVAGLALDTIGGAEKIAVVDVSTNKHVTADTLKTYIISALVGAAAVTPTTGDAVVMERAGTEGTFDLDALADYILAYGWTNATNGAPVTNVDQVLIDRSGTIFDIDVDDLATYINSAVLDLSVLTADTPAASDLFLFHDGAEKKITLANLETQLWADFLTYVDGLTENTTVTATDKIYCIQGGVDKWVDPDALATYFSVPAGDVTGPVTTTTDNVPQWDVATKALKDGLQLQTTIRSTGAATDTALATEQAIREEFDAIAISGLDIDGASDIAAALVDADLIIVDDGAGGTNRKSEMSRVWTYISGKTHAITVLDIDGASDIGADLVDADLIIVDDGAGGTNRKSAVSRVKTYTNKIQTASYAANQTLTAAECNGYVVYVTGAATIILPPVADGMSVTIITIGNVAVSVDPDAADKIWLDGTALDDGDKITNASTAGDMAVLTYYSADGWHASTNGWSDGGP